MVLDTDERNLEVAPDPGVGGVSSDMVELMRILAIQTRHLKC